MSDVSILSPWNCFYKEVECLFEDDPEVKVVIEDKHVKLYVSTADKAEALEEILPTEKVFGNVVVKITVYPPNFSNMSDAEIYEKAFSGNNKFVYVKVDEGDLGRPSRTYVCFSRMAAQYYSDNLKDVNRNTNLLVEDLVRRIVDETAETSFCTV